MSVKTILFDLDGTLLPMDQELFVKSYLKRLAAALAPHGYDPDALVKSIWEGTGAMVQNNGSQLNMQVFWDSFAARFGEKARNDEPLFEEFYRTGFPAVQESCGFAPQAKEVLDRVKSLGLKVVLATNPIFPAIATHQRVQWAGLKTEDFIHITTYENASFCKPNPAYYAEILEKLGLQAEECLMVGNDVVEDMVAETLGMQVFLLTPCIINKKDADISRYPHGDFNDLLAFLDNLDPVTFSPAAPEDLEQIMALQVQVFTGEQQIPEHLVYAVQDAAPQWYCAKRGNQVLGTVAVWQEGDVTHWGRFAVQPALRNHGIGKRLARYSLEQSFARGIQRIYIEARETTVHILRNMGGHVIGAPVPFYVGTVTPTEVLATDFQ